MRLAFLGTPEPAVVVLRALVEAGHDVATVITRPDRRRGRGGALQPSAVKAAAVDLTIPVGHSLGDVEVANVELVVVVAFGAMIPATLLERTAMLNVHFSLLPRWRGAAPIERAILAGDDVTGVSIMSLDEGLDTGPVHLVRRTAIDAKTALDLRVELAALGAEALLEVLASRTLLATPKPQEGEATYAAKLTNETYHVIPSMTTAVAARTVRLGRAFCFVAGRRLGVSRVHRSDSHVASGSIGVRDGAVLLGLHDGAVVLDAVHPEGARMMEASAWWLGARLDADNTRWS